MNLMQLLSMLFPQRIPADQQVRREAHPSYTNVSPGMVLPLYMEKYHSQPRYTPPDQKLQDLEDLEKLYWTMPRRGAMPRRTRLGVEEGYRSDDWKWLTDPNNPKF